MGLQEIGGSTPVAVVGCGAEAGIAVGGAHHVRTARGEGEHLGSGLAGELALLGWAEHVVGGTFHTGAGR